MSVALDVARQRGAPAQDEDFSSEYLQALRLIERLHRLLLDVIKDEFDRLGGADLNSVQALLLYNIGESELTAGELKTRGYYLGSNVSYNLKKLVDMGYLHYKRSETDRRSVRVSLTEKGKEACDVVQKLYQRQLGSVETVGEVTEDDFRGAQQGSRPARALLVGPDPLPPLRRRTLRKQGCLIATRLYENGTAASRSPVFRVSEPTNCGAWAPLMRMADAANLPFRPARISVHCAGLTDLLSERAHVDQQTAGGGSR